MTPLLAAGAAAVAIVAAPAAAATPLSCADVGSATQCTSPGNSQLTAVAPHVQIYPQFIIIHRNHR
ncbi:hypothetical protein [Mycolicibacterium sediminis]|nr:hypothetical protein [Mycolicibacterium sediminis]